MDLLFKDEAYAIIGAAMAVHRELGCGFLEKVYQEALAIEFKLRGIPFEREKHLTVSYKGHLLAQDYYADFVCYGKIIVELKAISELNSEHTAQVINYLNCAKVPLGLLINFGETSLVYKRLALSSR